MVVIVALAATGAGVAAGRQMRTVSTEHDQPRPSVLTAPVERRVLEHVVVTRGDVRHAEATDVVVEGAIHTGDSAPRTPVVTGRVPEVGQQVEEGTVILEVAGRPVFLLSGTLPTYRSIGPGTTGPDVAQLNAALRRLRYGGPVGDRFSDATAAAVERLYRAVGYEPAAPAPAERAALRAAEQQVGVAAGSLRAAEAALASADSGPARSDVVAAEGEVRSAQLALEAARQDRTDGVASAAPEDRDSTRRAHDVAVSEAETRLAVARARLAELHLVPDLTAELGAVESARRAHQLAMATRDELRATTGVRVPQGEVVFVPQLPRRVERVAVGPGDRLDGPALTLTGVHLEVVTDVAALDRTRLQVGGPVEVDDPALGIEVRGSISSIAAAPGTDGAPPGSYAVVVALDREGSKGPVAAGLNLRVTMPVDSTAEPVLVVPVSALTTDANGTTRVLVDGATERRDVEVVLGLVAGGYAEVRPVTDDLEEGDHVVLGRAWPRRR